RRVRPSAHAVRGAAPPGLARQRFLPTPALPLADQKKSVLLGRCRQAGAFLGRTKVRLPALAALPASSASEPRPAFRDPPRPTCPAEEQVRRKTPEFA